MKKNIGVKLKVPKAKCEDKKCPFHGNVRVRGREFTGIVVETDAHRSATVEWPRVYHVPKYERYEKRKTRIRVHNPSCINAKKGDKIRIMETRPLSKTKKFVIIEKIGTDVLFKQREEALEEAKVKDTKEEKKDASVESKGN